MPVLRWKRAILLSLLLPAFALPGFAGDWGEAADESSASYASPRVPDAQTRGGALPPVTPPPLRDPDEEWVETTLAGLTLDEKIGQMLMPQWTSGSASGNLSTYHVGGFVFLATTSSTTISATNALQNQADVPLLFSIDAEAGVGARLGDGTIFPMNMALAASGREDLAFQQGVITARETRAAGIQIAFGPVLDVNTEPVNPIIGIRAFGDRPELVERMAAPYVQGAASAGLLTTYKHFPGHGATEGDSHQLIPLVDIRCVDLQGIHVRPYATLLGQGTGDLVMTAHVWFPCLDPGPNAWPATISEAAMNGILRQQLDYDGVLITDAFNMQGLQDAVGTYDGARIAVLAGVDIILMPPSVSDAFNGLKDAVTGGLISQARIDQSVRRILRLKSRVGLPEAALVDPADAAATLLHPDHLAVAEEIGREAVAVFREEPGVLPLRPEHDVLVLPFFTNTQIFYLFPHTEFSNTLDAALPNVTVQTVGTSISSSERAAIIASATNYDRIVVTSRSWRPSNTTAQQTLLNDLLATGVPVIYLSFGSPYHLFDAPDLETYFCAFSSHYASQREAVEVLLGKSQPQGTWPVTLIQEPLPALWMAR